MFIHCPVSLEAHSDERDGKLPREIRQMFLVLQNVHLTPPDENYFFLQQLVGKVVKPYLPMVARSRTIVKVPTESSPDGECKTFHSHNKVLFCPLHLSSPTP